MRYKKPLLTESYVEFRLTKDMDAAVLFNRFPELATKKLKYLPNEYVFSQKIKGIGPNKFEIENMPRVQLFNHDKTMVLQAYPKGISLHNINTYLGWQAIKGILADVHLLVNELGFAVDAIGFGTIDTLVVPSDNFKLGHYFNCDGYWIPHTLHDTAKMCDIQLGHELLELDGRNQQLNLKVRLLEGATQVTLHSKFYRKLNGDRSLDVIDELHEESTNLFERLITDATREEMEVTDEPNN